MGYGELLTCVEVERFWRQGSGCETYWFSDRSSLSHFIFSDGKEVLIIGDPDGVVAPDPYDGRYPYTDRQAENVITLRERRRGRGLIEPGRSALKTVLRAAILREVYCKHDEATKTGAGGEHTGLDGRGN